MGVATASQPWQYIAGELVEVGVDLEGLAEAAVEGLEHAEDPDCTGASSSSRQGNARWSDALSAAALDRTSSCQFSSYLAAAALHDLPLDLGPALLVWIIRAGQR